jgi:hypothetical protein
VDVKEHAVRPVGEWRKDAEPDAAPVHGNQRLLDGSDRGYDDSALASVFFHGLVDDPTLLLNRQALKSPTKSVVPNEKIANLSCEFHVSL